MDSPMTDKVNEATAATECEEAVDGIRTAWTREVMRRRWRRRLARADEKGARRE